MDFDVSMTDSSREGQSETTAAVWPLCSLGLRLLLRDTTATETFIKEGM